MKNLLQALLPLVALLALTVPMPAAEPIKAAVESYRVEDGQHVFTIKGKDYFIPITTEIDKATAQSAARHVASDVAAGIPLDPRPAPSYYFPYTPLPQSSCPNGQCPAPPSRRR